MKMKFISQSKRFYGFCLIKVYKFTFSSCGSIVYTVEVYKLQSPYPVHRPSISRAGTPGNSWWGCAAQFVNS